MGWTTTHKPANISAKEFIERELLVWTSPTHQYRVLDGGVKNFRTYYGAVEKVELATGVRDVFAVIVLLSYSRDYYNFGYKDMSEDMGPYQTDCPARILDLLTPTTSQYANDWRRACRDKLARKAVAKKSQAAITVGTALNYAGVNYVVNMDLGRRGYQVINPQGRVYRLKKTQAAVATII